MIREFELMKDFGPGEGSGEQLGEVGAGEVLDKRAGTLSIWDGRDGEEKFGVAEGRNHLRSREEMGLELTSGYIGRQPECRLG